ncbi:caveolin-2 [Eleutherodactylus coqui]|uniref:Caveolin n=1 Tax=Eleutherodactylus coqui TaxID=57060 RepID=A0A8J6FLJ7_ELECQ|nr:hypothetical protein GDO78_005848 [Eleutherodactylus coqui]
MGLEKEKADARIFMDEDEFNRSSAPMLTEKTYECPPDRDPHDLNGHLMLSFEDVIAEPASTHSLDKVWICSTAVYEVSKYVLYKLLTALLAIPLAFVIGLLFAVLSCLHIWVVMPFVRTCLMVLPSVQAIWKGITDSLVAPVFASMGRCFASVNVRVDQPF